MLWSTSSATRDHNPLKMGREFCLYCSTALVSHPDSAKHPATVRYCPVCGWWWVERVQTHGFLGGGNLQMHGTYVALAEFDTTDINTPLQEVRQYLVARYNDRMSMAWELFEDVVREVFRDSGFTVVASGRRKDGGIDAVLSMGTSSGCIGVQIKRSRNQIQVAQIRSFLGALMLKGLAAGVFVTTSGFTKGARQAAAASPTAAGVPVELVDASKFFDALHFTTRAPAPASTMIEEVLAGHLEYTLIDEVGFELVKNARWGLIEAFYKSIRRKTPWRTLAERTVWAGKVQWRPGLECRGFQVMYEFDPVLRRYFGIAGGPSRNLLLFDSETEAGIKVAFERQVHERMWYVDRGHDVWTS